jgi:glucose-1-phosphate cytidylyltransferase
MQMKVASPAGWERGSRRRPHQAQADGRDRRQADLWHIMSIYAAQGYGSSSSRWAAGRAGQDYFLIPLPARSLTIQLDTGKVSTHSGEAEDWVVHLLDTGADTQTGGRVKRLAEYIGPEPFMLTYGDGVGNVDVAKLIEFHRRQGKLGTLTAVRPPSRFGQMVVTDGRVAEFKEKPQLGEGWINGGFFVLEPGILDYIAGDGTSFEFDALEHLAADGQLAAYQHEAFWQCMDTARDVLLLDRLWSEGNAPWKLWR